MSAAIPLFPFYSFTETLLSFIYISKEEHEINTMTMNVSLNTSVFLSVTLGMALDP
jgi:hypothetical protein